MMVLYLAMLYINFLSGTGKINGISAGEVSALYPTYFTPAGYTFSIWGVIYLFNLWFVIYAIARSFGESADYPSRPVILLYLLSCVLNIGWIFAWHHLQILTSLFLISLLLATLLLIYQKVTTRAKKSAWEYISTVIPISLYLGWLLVATLANAAVTISGLGWKAFGSSPAILASSMVVIAALVNLVILIWKKDIFLSLVFLWAATGIISARRADDLPGSDQVAVTSLVCMGMVFLFMIFTRFFVIRKEKAPSPENK